MKVKGTEKQGAYIEKLIKKLEDENQKVYDDYGEYFEEDAEDSEKAMIEFNKKRIAFTIKNAEKILAGLLIDGLNNPFNPIWKMHGIVKPSSF